MAPDMWSGWGIRTLSTENPAFNPYNYQTGSVWPHDNAIIALGFKRYGFGVEVARIARDISDAASHFLCQSTAGTLHDHRARREEVFRCNISGRTCRRRGRPVRCLPCCRRYSVSCPTLRAGNLYVDPLLPAWLPDLTVLDLRVGKQRFDIRFWREGPKTQFEVLQGDPNAIERGSFGANFSQLEFA